MTESLAPASFAIDWDQVRDEVVAHLQALIRLETVNPPGNEITVARYLERVLRAEAIEVRVVEPAPGKAALRATLPGSGSAGGPLLLLAHMDVVPVERAKWSVDPFAGEVREGYVYGRGAIDDKGMLAVNLVTLLLLQRWRRAGGTLDRDVALVTTSDEETGGAHNIGWVGTYHPELLEGTDAINEGGRVRIVGGRTLYAAVQCAEKVSHRVTLTTTGPAGHASIPLADNALWRLGRALAALGAHREPLTLIPTTEAFFRTLASVWPDAEQAAAMADLVSGDPGRAALGEAAIARIPNLDALVRAGVSATVVRGGEGPNVIPGEARATLNVRTLPGQTIDEVLQRVTATIDDPRVQLTVEASGVDAPCTPHDARVYEAMAASARELVPDLAVVPYLSTGATDSAVLRSLGVRCFGILPFPLEPQDESRMHGHDERVPVEGLRWGVQLLWGTVTRAAIG
ncbi:MAG TPA: M20/M25/M40 family metallo-hydrolase [Gemmatimonadaceae bacterium]|nr:M20/M25/M40 family metallo-hydrolase [Gemmatimonadaceae bacterium]